MKKFFWILGLILDHAARESRKVAPIAPLAIAAIVNSAITIGKKIKDDIEAKNAAEKLDQEKAATLAEEQKRIDRQTKVAEGIAKQGDPTLAEKTRQIEAGAANAIGKATATGTSTQEIINSAQTVQKNKDAATNQAQTDAATFKLKASEVLSSRFASAGQQRLGAKALINQEANIALGNIGANAQAGVDTFQNIGSQFTQLAGLGAFDANGNKKKASTATPSTNNAIGGLSPSLRG